MGLPLLSRFLFAFQFLTLSGFSAAPQWWTDYQLPGPLVDAEDSTSVSKEQMMYFAGRAREYFHATLPGGADSTIDTFLKTWSMPGQQSDDHHSVTVGQLKTLATPFHDRLIAVKYTKEYPWKTQATNDENNGVASVGQLKALFAFDLSLDEDQPPNGLPDWWERYYFHGKTGIDAEFDSDGDGISNSKEYLQFSDPNDFFNGAPPVFTIVSGNNQGDLPEFTLANPLVVCLRNQKGTPKPNAAVAFKVLSGGGKITLVNAGHTDKQGMSRANLELPGTAGATVLVEAAHQTLNVTFTSTVGDASLAPAAAEDLKVTMEQGIAVALLEWKDCSNNEVGFYLERAHNGKDWTRIATLPANTTSYTDKAVIADNVYFYRVVAYNDAK